MHAVTLHADSGTKWPPECQQLVEQRLVRCRCRIVDAVSRFLTPSSPAEGKFDWKTWRIRLGSCCSTANFIMIKRHGTKLRLSEWLNTLHSFSMSVWHVVRGVGGGGGGGVGGSQSRSVCLLVGECALKCVHSVVYAGPCFWQASRPHCQAHLVGQPPPSTYLHSQ